MIAMMKVYTQGTAEYSVNEFELYTNPIIN